MCSLYSGINGESTWTKDVNFLLALWEYPDITCEGLCEFSTEGKGSGVANAIRKMKKRNKRKKVLACVDGTASACISARWKLD